MQHILSIIMILIGAVIMLFSLVKARELHILTPFIPERSKSAIIRSLRLHRGLMLFFFLVYCAVAGVFFLGLPFVGEILVGFVFLSGAIFVLLGLHLQSSMLLEIKNTLHGLLPICASCKKIRSADGDPHDPAAWSSVEAFISAKTSADFTHSICPDCLKKLYPDIYK
ncbi:hypothetical protein [Thiovibrio frasassiensis]|jgi:hypothetical protein|uniref:Uncharacterized protein n=1 Tax=Thiovibrio frasassiensis TaxID=2984131 RepID=A0A9X4RPX9_9BACT|nr:hypothetical protein [Thiovibrio frasassiensis]MDG4475687.1 hypothetical protein [Thiovibrio frasassiensis]